MNFFNFALAPLPVDLGSAIGEGYTFWFDLGTIHKKQSHQKKNEKEKEKGQKGVRRTLSMAAWWWDMGWDFLDGEGREGF